MRYSTITMRELDRWINSGKPMLLADLRTKEEYDRGHIDGAVHLPFAEMEGWMGQLPKDLPIVFYCQRGSKSLLVCNRLCRYGFWVVNTAGGLAAYRYIQLTDGRNRL